MRQPTRRHAIHPFKWLALACIALAQGCSHGAPEPTIASQTQAVSGAAFTTDNASVDGDSKDVCKNSSINCNIYGAKEYVWLNGGPTANGLGPDGDYFFAVLVPGGQPDPNDGSLKNLSDDFDAYTNRTFTVTDGEVSAYTGDHWLDSGSGPACHNAHTCGEPDGDPPLIRLYPYADTTNPGGVYIMAICSLAGGYPVEPRDCKYDAFKVKEGPLTYSLMLSGIKFQDTYADAVKDDSNTDPALASWTITIDGTGFACEEIHDTEITGADGAWLYQEDYTFKKSDPTCTAELTVCEVPQEGWTQSYPDTEDGCYSVSLGVSALAAAENLDFGNWQPVDVTACKVQDLDGDDSTTDDRVPVPGWSVSLLTDGLVTDTQTTGDDGCYTWTGLEPGHEYSVEEGDKDGWMALDGTREDFGKAGSNDSFDHTFVNAVLQGCTPGFWQGGSDGGQAGGQWLWNEENDLDWTASGGDGTNPYIWTDEFNSFFAPYAGLNGFTMMDLVGTGGGPDDFQKAGRSLVAAYLNASWGMNYAYSTTELKAMWAEAVANGTFLDLHLLLDNANNAGYRTDGGPHCPISASLNF